MKWLHSIFRKTGGAARAAEPVRNIAPLQLTWRTGTTMPIGDWKAARRAAPRTDDAGALEDYWWSAALAWLEAMRAHLGGHYAITRSEHFALLSSLPDRKRQLTIEFCERTRRRILRALDGIASRWGNGPHVVFIFDNDDQYYSYIGNYYPKRGVFAMSSGVFLPRGYGHFVFVASELYAMEPIIAHELTHCLLAKLPLPAWLNEGTAVNMETALTPGVRDPRRGIFEHREKARERRAFWNAETIQQFWSGKSFLRPDEGSAQSYDLGTELTRLLAKDYDNYRAFMNRAQYADAGSEATQAVYGFTLADLASAVLGDGPWAPDPEKWHDGMERGQFSNRIGPL